MKKFGVGVIGLGVGIRHVRSFESHPNCEIVSVCDFLDEKLAKEKEHNPFLKSTKDANQILEDPDIDIISVASYDNYHSSQIIQAINARKHVMAEKPLCMNIDEMVQIQAAHKQNSDIKISANHVLRTNPRFKRFKTDIANGKFGDIFYLEGDYYWGRRHKLFGWRAEMDFYSIILGAAIHMIDLVMWLMNAKPISVQAVGNDIASINTSLKYNSFAVILLQFENGIIAKLTGNGGSVHPHFHGLKIFGTEQTAIHTLTEAYNLHTSDINSELVPITEPYPEKKVREKVIHSFVDSILDPSISPLVSYQDVYDVMSVCFAAEEAMNSGKSISIEYLN